MPNILNADSLLSRLDGLKIVFDILNIVLENTTVKFSSVYQNFWMKTADVILVLMHGICLAGDILKGFAFGKEIKGFKVN